jgi:EmrB/QacA subfamily drug resistance transporter
MWYAKIANFSIVDCNIERTPAMAHISRNLSDNTKVSNNLRAPFDIKKTGPWILLATILGSSMVFIDSNVVNVALPRLQVDLNVSATDVQWVVEAYSLFLAALILVGGSLGDSFGRKRLFAIGVGLFALASIGCGLALNVTQLIAMRSLQGVGGAMLTPGSLSIIRALFPPAQRGRAIGLWSGFSAITTVIGPLLGGWLVQYASWRWIFFINVPLAVIVLIVLFWRVPESRNVAEHVHLDWPGALLATFSLGAIVYGLIQSNNLGLLNPLVLGTIGAGVLALISFIVVEILSPAPMMPLILFRSATFSGSNLLTFLLYAALGGTLYFLPFNLIRVQGYTPTAAGAAFVPFTLILFSLSRWSGGLVVRYGSKLPLVVGPLIAACGFVLFAIPGIGGSYWTTYFPAVVVLGIGMAITVAPLTTTVLGAVEDRYAGIASGINNAVSRVAALLAIAVLNIFVLQAFKSNLIAYMDTLKVPPTIRQGLVAQSSKLAGTEVPPGIEGALRAALSRAIALSFVDAFRLAMWIGAGLALAGALCALFLVEGKTKKDSQGNT